MKVPHFRLNALLYAPGKSESQIAAVFPNIEGLTGKQQQYIGADMDPLSTPEHASAYL